MEKKSARIREYQFSWIMSVAMYIFYQTEILLKAQNLTNEVLGKLKATFVQLEEKDPRSSGWEGKWGLK